MLPQNEKVIENKKDRKNLSGDDCSVDLLLSSDSFSTAEGCMDVGARCKEKANKVLRLANGSTSKHRIEKRDQIG